MNAKRKVNRCTISLKQKPMRHLEQREDPELTPSQKQAIVRLFAERIYIPVVNGKVPIREIFSPAGRLHRS